jgi:acetyl-CoA carboxylase carboxyltransferase component
MQPSKPWPANPASSPCPPPDGMDLRPGSIHTVTAPVQGTVVSVPVAPGDAVERGAPVAVIESMKMEHVVSAASAGAIRSVAVEPGALVAVGDQLVVMEVSADSGNGRGEEAPVDLDAVRADLAELGRRQAGVLDSARPDVVARRHQRGRRTARENVADLCDPGTFTEYGSLAIAAQRARRPLEELMARTPADGLVAGIGRVNGSQFGDRRSSCAVLSYDYTVLAGTQGQQNHRKKDRLFELIERLRLPVVLFAEGGGGRPGDTDYAVITGLDTLAFSLFGRLSGLVPMVGIASGWCFAGNAALLGCCDVIIATKDASIGMGGPAMIEGGGLGSYGPEEVGPLDVQVPNGVVDLVADDDADAVRLARSYLSYFQGPSEGWSCADQRLLRSAVPEERLRVYDVRRLLGILADDDSVMELRQGFAGGMVTALVRVEGRPIGVVANNPGHLGGAIDSDGADKAARFLQLCDAHDVPILFLCDTPGFMVGPEAERTAQVRHFGRLFVIGASLTVPFFTMVLRKGYGLGAQAMAGGSFRSPIFTVAWPSGELGGMGLEGAVRLGFRRELEAVEDPEQREAQFQSMVERAYQHGRAINVATAFEIDDVIDPADSRRRIVDALRAAPPPPPRTGKKRSCVDTW